MLSINNFFGNIQIVPFPHDFLFCLDRSGVTWLVIEEGMSVVPDLNGGYIVETWFKSMIFVWL